MGVEHDAGTSAVAAELGHVTGLLRQLVNADRSELAQLVVLDTAPTATVLDHFPTERSRRFLVHRTGNGNTTPVDTNGELILDRNEARIGGLIVNTGAVGVTLYFAKDANGGRARTWLGPNGGAFDFLLGHVLWGGPIFAVADSGSSTVVVAEL